METYEHRQFSPLILAAALAPLALASMLGVPFTFLQTRVDEGGISFAFGLGFPSGRIRFDEIAAVQITKTRFFEGFGIHWNVKHGWLWNAAGSDAVMIRKRDGRAVTLGTDDAQGLYDAIQRNWRSKNDAAAASARSQES
jgi:hypothetical protein